MYIWLMIQGSLEVGSVLWWKTPAPPSQVSGKAGVALQRDECLMLSDPPLKKKNLEAELSFISKWGRRPSPFSLTNPPLHFGTDKFKQDENQIASAYLIPSAPADNIINVAVGERKLFWWELFSPLSFMGKKNTWKSRLLFAHCTRKKSSQKFIGCSVCVCTSEHTNV